MTHTQNYPYFDMEHGMGYLLYRFSNKVYSNEIVKNLKLQLCHLPTRSTCHPLFLLPAHLHMQKFAVLSANRMAVLVATDATGRNALCVPHGTRCCALIWYCEACCIGGIPHSGTSDSWFFRR